MISLTHPCHPPLDMTFVLNNVTVLPRALPSGCACGAVQWDHHLWIFVDPDKPNATLHARAMLATEVSEGGIFHLPGNPQWEEAMRCYDEVLDALFPEEWFTRAPRPAGVRVQPQA